METIYQTIVKDCGCDVGAFDKKNFLITFGHKTLVTLKDFCYFIDVTPLKKKIWAGDILKIDDQEYEILRIGEIASDNLAALGHITIFFTEEGECLPGSIRVKGKEFPKIEKESKIEPYREIRPADSAGNQSMELYP